MTRYVNSQITPIIKVKPMYQLKSPHAKDTWYTCDYATVLYAQKEWNEQYGGIDGYVITP